MQDEAFFSQTGALTRVLRINIDLGGSGGRPRVLFSVERLFFRRHWNRCYYSSQIVERRDVRIARSILCRKDLGVLCAPGR